MTRQFHQAFVAAWLTLLLLGTALSTSVRAQVAPSPDELSKFGPLHEAAHFGDIDTIRSLIAAGVDLESRDSAGRTALHVAAFASNEAVLKLLARAGANVNALENDAYDIVTIAAVANDIEFLDAALELGASAANITSPYDGTALIAAAHLGHYQVVERLIANNAPLNHINNLEWTALIEAVILGDGGSDHIRTVELLLAAGADRTIGDGQGTTAREHAQSRGYIDMLRIFDEVSVR